MSDPSIPPFVPANEPGTPPQAAAPREKPINLPPLTFGLWLIFTAIHIVRALKPDLGERLANLWAFMPAAFTAHPAEQSFTVVTYGLLHFGWMHYFMNMTGLMAFGSGIEKLFGKAYYLLILIGGTIIGALGHWALDPQSMILLGGASAGISALFGALMPIVATGRSFWSAVIVFCLANILIGVIGMPTQPGLAIAWQAHLFGFAFGLAVAKLIRRN